jgi:hypothetical protein
LFNLPLNTTIELNGFLDVGSLQYTPLPTGDPILISDNGSIWQDAENLYLYSSLQDKPVSSQIWSFHPANSSWNRVNVQGTAILGAYSTESSSVDVPDIGLSFFVGGDTANSSGLIRFDSSNGQLSWENETVPLIRGMNGAVGPHRAGAALVHVPIGEKGVLVQMGGFVVSGEKKKGCEFVASGIADYRHSLVCPMVIPMKAFR